VAEPYQGRRRRTPPFHHIIDIAADHLEAAGVKAPEMVDGIKQKADRRRSMAYTFDKANANAPSKRKTQYFEK